MRIWVVQCSLVALSALITPSVSFGIDADFDAGNTSMAVDGYVGMSGDGWTTEWQPALTIDGGTGLISAIRTIIVADLVMSVDNVIAIAAAAEQSSNAEHQMGLVIFGLLVSVPIIVWGSRIVLGIIERHPIVIWFGGGLLGWIAGGMIVTDRIVHDWIGPQHDMVPTIASVIGALLVIATGKWLLMRRTRDGAGKAAAKDAAAGKPESRADSP